MTDRTPGMERPESSQHPESYKEERKYDFLESRGIVNLRKLEQIKCTQPRFKIEGEHPDENEGASDKEIKGELHCPIFLSGGSPDPNEKIHRKDCQFVKDEKEKKVECHEDSEDAGDQSEEKDEKLLRSVFDIPGYENSCKEDKSGEKDKRKTHTIHADMKIDAELGNPRSF